MLSIKPERPVEPIIISVLREVDSLARELDLEYFVTGAMARDLLLTSVYGFDTQRVTRDVDIAIAVESWERFRSIRTRLIAGGAFVPLSKVMHRLTYIATDNSPGCPLDIIPFRGVEEPEHSISWPPDMKVVMNVMGYEDALKSVVSVQVDEELVMRVTGISGLVLLKCFAWLDRHHETTKDAQDLAILLRLYGDVSDNADRIYGMSPEILEALDYNVAVAGSRLLGRDVRGICTPKVLDRLIGVLEDGGEFERLAIHMASAFAFAEDAEVMATALLAEFQAGLVGS